MAQNSFETGKMRQYILTGAGLGLYFGWFFRPVREPNFMVALGLSLFITLVMTLIRLWRSDRAQLLQRAGITFVQYLLVLAVLEARHFAFDAGGRFGVIALTTIFGALGGYLMAQRGNISQS